MNELARLLHKTFSTNQSNYLEQQRDGTYRKRSGEASVKRIEQMLKNGEAIAVLQRNKDATVKWICFDFDIVKGANKEETKLQAEKELKECVINFCRSLKEQDIAFLLEFSGNRGFHIWVTFESPISYWVAYDLQQAIIEHSSVKFNEKLIALDLFPRSKNPSGGIGSGVKIPLSLHAKSGMYARFVSRIEDVLSCQNVDELSASLIRESVEILGKHKNLNLAEIEMKTGRPAQYEAEDEDSSRGVRIAGVTIGSPFSLDDLLRHWKTVKPLEVLAVKISQDKQLNTAERRLLVGLLGRISGPCDFKGESVLHQIFEQMENYDAEKTTQAIQALSSFSFPSKNQIENVVGVSFQREMSVADLIKSCVPNYAQHDDCTFTPTHVDVEVTRLAELNYIRTNDEVHARKVINDLGGVAGVNDLNVAVARLMEDSSGSNFYTHDRQELNKVRKLVTLEAPERVATSLAMKLIISFFDLKASGNSYGYSVNRGFKGGHIFAPWLNRWVQFTANIAAAIADKEYSQFYIVKTDIKSFYDEIPHDNVKRILLEGAGIEMKLKIQNLSGKASADYKKLVDLLFGVTRSTVGGAVGFPQGPAYARWLAELYLASLDDQFDQLIEQDSICFYHRFVDDIFFVAQSEAEAIRVLQQARRTLESLGLQVNEEKTICKWIKDFTLDFDHYRSQSKYAVDKVSRSFGDATDGEKDNAIDEFLKLLQSDTCNEDLSFIYSHLTGVELLDKKKREKVLPVLLSQVGRGSLFRHLFHFVLDDPGSWDSLEQVDAFGALQSEVFSECLLDYMHEPNSRHKEALTLLDAVQPKLSKTRLTLEHLAFISVCHGRAIDSRDLSPMQIVNALMHVESASLLQIPPGLVTYVNTELNNLRDLGGFIHVLYAICAASNIESTDLNELASIFFSKISYEETNGGLLNSSGASGLARESLARLYYLICLFSVSKAGSEELVRAAWRSCIELCNEAKAKGFNAYGDDWLRKIDGVEVDNKRVLWILSSIADGHLIRGTNDICRLFERYHSALLVFFALGTTKIDLDKISEALSKVSEKANFYSWLTARNGVTIFPNSNKLWFDKNLLENDVILLKKGGELLVRRPAADFCSDSEPVNTHLGFSEVVVPFDFAEMASLKNTVECLKFIDQLGLLCDLLAEGAKRGSYPNIFQQEPMIRKESRRSAVSEFDRTKKLVLEEAGGDVSVRVNDKSAFIYSFLHVGRSSEAGLSLRNLGVRYINNLEGDAEKFLAAMRSQLIELNCADDDFTLDLAASAALYSLFEDGDEEIYKFRRFVDQYHKFHSKAVDRAMYAYDENTVLVDDSPSQLLDSVIASLSLIRSSGYESVPIYLDKDLQEHKERLEAIASASNPQVALSSFQKASVRVSNTRAVLNVNGEDFDFDRVSLLHSASNCLRVFSHDYSNYVSSSEHVYFLDSGEKIYVLAMDPAITKCYRSLQERIKAFSGKAPARSFPVPAQKRSIDYQSIARWTQAVDVMKEHRGVLHSEAGQLLEKWLNYLPGVFHEPLVSLIASHEVMTYEDRKGFLSYVEQLLATGDAVFGLKDPADYNGTQRLLYDQHAVGRQISRLNPLSINGSPSSATVVVDVLLSGSQSVKALKYYFMADEQSFEPGYYFFDEARRRELAAKLSALSLIRICCVLYTSKALNYLQSEISSLLGRPVAFEVAHGRNIDESAFFESSSKLGMSEKDRLRKFLLDSDVQFGFNKYFVKNKFAGKINAEKLAKANLVARYQSVPKKSLWFLSAGLRANESCSALVQIAEMSR